MISGTSKHPQSGSHLPEWTTTDEKNLLSDSCTDTSEDFIKLGVELQHIPFILAAEQSPTNLPPLGEGVARGLVDTLDKVPLLPKSFLAC